jgi:hypothetical protein
MTYFEALEPSVKRRSGTLNEYMKSKAMAFDHTNPMHSTIITNFAAFDELNSTEIELPDWIESNLQDSKPEQFSHQVQTVNNFVVEEETSEIQNMEFMDAQYQPSFESKRAELISDQELVSSTTISEIDDPSAALDTPNERATEDRLIKIKKGKKAKKSKLFITRNDAEDDFSKWLLSFQPITKSHLETFNPSKKSERGNKFVEGLAKKSLTKPEILSETYADLLQKQGQYVKSLEINTALAAKFPEKSTFFAEKIKTLKELING